jgi:hypothetical protein
MSSNAPKADTNAAERSENLKKDDVIALKRIES